MSSILLMCASQCKAYLEDVAVGDFRLFEVFCVEGRERVVCDMPKSISSVIKQYF